jgi:guanylate kinase
LAAFNKNYIFALNGPSASGKTTIMENILKDSTDIEQLVTVTTRLKRENECNGKDYIFISPEEFEVQKAKENIVEETIYAGVKYGIFASEIERIRSSNKDAIVVLDMHGISELKRFYGDEIVKSIFIYRELDTIKEELSLRNVSQEEKDRRFNQAKEEQQNWVKSDYAVHNTTTINEATKKVIEIIKTQEN